MDNITQQKNNEKLKIIQNNCSGIVEDIKKILFDDRDYDSLAQFVTWIGDGHSFIIQDEYEQEYRVTVTKEEI